jgi:carboxymethylenebutenolidase
MAIQEQMTRLTAADGFAFDAFVATPAGEPRGGLVILQEIFGVTEQLKSVARGWAADGYTTSVPALFDRVSPGTVVPFDTPDRGRELMLSLDPEAVLRDIAAAIAGVESGHGVSVLGFCWGGGLALKAACTFELRGAVAYYGTNLGRLLEHPPRCPMLFHFGASDSHSPPEVIDAVRAAIPSAETYVYTAGHAFANDARASHVPDAAREARTRTRAFLDQLHPA